MSIYESVKRTLRAAALEARGRKLTPAERADLVARCNREKHLVFTVNPGRAGSAKLTQLFSCIGRIDARHEPAPSFHHFLRSVQHRPRLAETFLAARKLPDILASDKPVYFEASHHFSKGFLEPALELGLSFDLVVLSRDPAKVAASFFSLGVIPGMSRMGLMHSLSPDDPVLLPLPDWRRRHPYQLCYWYALEMDRRAEHYAAAVRAAGGRVARIATAELSVPGAFETLLGALRLDPTAEDLERITAIRDERTNEKMRAKQNVAATLPGDRLQLDADLRQALA